jgi:SH3-like domain-containing protein
MNHFTRWILPLLLILFSLLAGGCQRVTPAVPPASTPLPPPALPSFPTRPAVTPTASPTVTPETAKTSTPVAAVTPEPAPASAQDVIGGAYVDVLRTSLLAEPGGEVLAPLAAGQRLEILGASPDRAWLKVRYQPNPDDNPLTGWVRNSGVHTFIDVAEIPVVVPEGGAVPTMSATAPEAPAGLATVQARRLNLRAGPGVDQAVIDQLNSGQQVTLLGRSDNAQWLKVQTETGATGWAAAAWLRSDADIKALPVAGHATTSVPKPAALAGKIIFQDRPGGSIYIINADGTGLKRLTWGLDPAFSPDGKQIVFARWQGSGDGIYLMDIDGSREREVMGVNKPRSPTWSPDGQTLIYERPTGEKICRSTPFGCLTDDELRQMFGGEECKDFSFGRYCIDDFPLTTQSFSGLEAFSLTNGDIRDIPTGPSARAPRHHPTLPQALHLTPQGAAIAFTQEDTPPRLLFSYPELGAPAYSPDGRFIYVSRKDGDSWNIWRYNGDGSNPVALTHPPMLRDRPISNTAPAASPDGRSILFLTDRNGSWQIWMMNSDGSAQRPFASRALSDIDFRFDFGLSRMIDWK